MEEITDPSFRLPEATIATVNEELGITILVSASFVEDAQPLFVMAAALGGG